MTLTTIIDAAFKLWPKSIARMLAGMRTQDATEMRKLVAAAAREFVPWYSAQEIARQVGLKSHTLPTGCDPAMYDQLKGTLA